MGDFLKQCRWMMSHAVMLAALIIAMAFGAPASAQADGSVIGVRGSVLEFFTAKGGGTPALTMDRNQGRALRKNPLAVEGGDGEWLKVTYEGQSYWIKAEQARQSADRPALSCGTKLGGSAAGASRGIGEGCRD